MVTNDNVEVALREWVEYNRANGVDRMVIFDNTLGALVPHDPICDAREPTQANAS